MKFISLIFTIFSIFGLDISTSVNTPPEVEAVPVPAYTEEYVTTPTVIVEPTVTVDSIAPEDMEAALLARCMTTKGVELYGSYTCPHCKTQEEMFGDGYEYINYIECNKNHEDADLEACKNAELTAYPTWVLPDGEQLIGTRQLNELAEATGC